MPSLTFTILPPGVAQLHEILICLAKFDENISLEAGADYFRLISLNISKTAHASFTLEAAPFFAKYHCVADLRKRGASSSSKAIWACQLQNRALQSIFKKRLAENREKDTALERCEVELQAQPDQTECRLIIRMVCRHGVVKTYRLTYESEEVLQANFDSGMSKNHWTVSSKTLRDVVEYFGPKTDQLDWYFENGKVIFTSYTEKVQNGREILKQPMHTSVTLEKKDFDDFNVQEGLHIGIVVKDFRAIISHAETLRMPITAHYSRGNQPMQIAYETDGILSEYTLMTRGHSSDVPTKSTASTPARDLAIKAVSIPPSSQRAPSISGTTQSATEMPPPIKKPSLRDTTTPAVDAKPHSRISPPAPSASINPDSMFIPDENDQQWDEPNYEDEPDYVMWDNASGFPSASDSTKRIRDSEPNSFRSMSDKRVTDTEGIAPTQRLSQVRGLFD